MLHHVACADFRQDLYVNMTEEDRQTHQKAEIKGN